LLRGIYSSATAMSLQLNKVMMHASNLSNSETYGYKRRSMVSRPFKEIMVNIISDRGQKSADGAVVGGNFVNSLKVPVGTGTGMEYLTIDHTEGSLQATGNPLDIAIDGDAWFTMTKKSATNGLQPSPDVYYSKAGRFILNSQGNITSPNGDFLLDVNNNPINIPLTSAVVSNLDKKKMVSIGDLSQRILIKSDGSLYDNGKLLAKIQVRRSNPKFDEYIKELSLVSPGTEAMTDPKNMVSLDGTPISLKQGYIEDSNIKIVEEMVGLIESQNNYESAHKLIMSEDKVLDKAINELGRTS